MADGPVSGPVHLRRSKLPKWPLASATHTTPLRSTSMPRGEKPCTAALGLFHGTSYTSASVVAGGFDPGFSRTSIPGKPSEEPQIEPSAGLGMTP